MGRKIVVNPTCKIHGGKYMDVDLHVGKLIDPCEKTYVALKETKKKNDLTKVLFLADFEETEFDGILMVYKFLLRFFVFFLYICLFIYFF